MSIGKNTALMTKEDKIAYIHYLDEHGAFLITKSGQRICEALSISKYTLYNYLEISRGDAKNNWSLSVKVIGTQHQRLQMLIPHHLRKNPLCEAVFPCIFRQDSFCYEDLTFCRMVFAVDDFLIHRIRILRALPDTKFKDGFAALLAIRYNSLCILRYPFTYNNPP